MTPKKDQSAEGVHKFELSLPSDMRYLDLINTMFQEIAGEFEFEKEEVEEIATSALEAVTNAIEHGNRMNPEKNVLISVEAAPGSFWFRVCDQGTGFDYCHLDNPIDPENLLRTRGRGIFIMRAFMDVVQFEFTPDQGLAVTLQKLKKQENRTAEA